MSARVVVGGEGAVQRNAELAVADDLKTQKNK